MKQILFGILVLATFVVAGTMIPPDVTPCDGQLVTGAIGTVEFRYCIHPVVAR